MGLIVDKILDDSLLDDSKVQGVCKHCGNTIILSTNMFEDICPHCGANIIIDDAVSDNAINITLEDL